MEEKYIKSEIFVFKRAKTEKEPKTDRNEEIIEFLKAFSKIMIRYQICLIKSSAITRIGWSEFFTEE